MYKVIFALSLLFSIASPSYAQISKLTDDNLNECEVLTGKKLTREFKAAYAEFQTNASAGSARDAIVLAQLANNRFACFEEDLNPDGGWTMEVESKGSGIVQTQSAAAFPVQSNPKALKALHEAVLAMKLAAEYSPEYGLVASEMMIRFGDIFAKDVPSAYLLSSRAQGIYCSYTRPSNTKQQWDYFCRNAKSLLKQMLPVVSATTRAEIETKANDWATDFARQKKYVKTAR